MIPNWETHENEVVNAKEMPGKSGSSGAVTFEQ
jgi:hypothetical protein